MIVDLVGNLDSDGQGAEGAPSVEECLGFVSLFFDQDGDGHISRAEVRQKGVRIAGVELRRARLKRDPLP